VALINEVSWETVRNNFFGQIYEFEEFIHQFFAGFEVLCCIIGLGVFVDFYGPRDIDLEILKWIFRCHFQIPIPIKTSNHSDTPQPNHPTDSRLGQRNYADSRSFLFYANGSLAIYSKHPCNSNTLCV
jgi:hypothetical protein